jgi:ABC-type multidrug transport system permease subunit
MELPVFLREHFNGMYRTDVYYLCKQLAEFPLFVITPIIFVGIFYFMVGMNPEIERFLIACAVILLVTQVRHWTYHFLFDILLNHIIYIYISFSYHFVCNSLLYYTHKVPNCQKSREKGKFCCP